MLEALLELYKSTISEYGCQCAAGVAMPSASTSKPPPTPSKALRGGPTQHVERGSAADAPQGRTFRS